jgi:hypothetical protein
VIILLVFLAFVPGRAAYAADYIDECKKQVSWQSGVEFVDSNDWNALSACVSKYRAIERETELAELRDFLKHNPRYRVPGQSLNRCWGKPREMPFESAYIRVDGNGFEAGVNYKDTLPAGCYENAPWDNREAKK